VFAWRRRYSFDWSRWGGPEGGGPGLGTSRSRSVHSPGWPTGGTTSSRFAPPPTSWSWWARSPRCRAPGAPSWPCALPSGEGPLALHRPGAGPLPLLRLRQERRPVPFRPGDPQPGLQRRRGTARSPGRGHLAPRPRAARRQSRREALIAAVEKAVTFYHQRLRRAPDAATARSYLRGRGYGTEQVGAYRLGYSPAGGDVLVRSLREEQVPERSWSPPAWGCALGRAPVRSLPRPGDVPHLRRARRRCGFRGARARRGGAQVPQLARQRLYSKSHLLYGLNWAKSAIVREGLAVVVEGYTDVIALSEARAAAGGGHLRHGAGGEPPRSAAPIHRTGGAHVRRRRSRGGGQPARLRAQRARRSRPAGGPAPRGP